MSNLSDMIVFLRKREGLSQDEMALKLGCSRSTIGMYETGKRVPPLEVLEEIADYFNIDMNTLTGNVASASHSIPGTVSYSPTTRIPVLGRIAAGFPLYAEQNIEGYTYIEAPDDGEYFGLVVCGDSMDAARIQDGDLLIVKRQESVDNGEIAVVLVNGSDATVKRFYQSGNTVTLAPQSTNPKHIPQIYDITKVEIRVQGKVVKVEFKI